MPVPDYRTELILNLLEEREVHKRPQTVIAQLNLSFFWWLGFDARTTHGYAANEFSEYREVE